MSQLSFPHGQSRANPAGIYLLKVNNRNTRARYEICSKLTIIISERRQWRPSSIFMVNFEHISHLVLVFYIVNFEHVIAGRECSFRDYLRLVTLSYDRVVRALVVKCCWLKFNVTRPLPRSVNWILALPRKS